MEFIDYGDANKILLAIFPPHSTHTLQVLDVVVFKSLSTQGLISVAKRDFFDLFWNAREASFTLNLIFWAFETFTIKKKREKPGKPIGLTQPDEYHGGAIFYSPRKVQRARDALREKEAAKAEEQRQKQLRATAGPANKAVKERLARERRAAQAKAAAKYVVVLLSPDENRYVPKRRPKPSGPPPTNQLPHPQTTSMRRQAERRAMEFLPRCETIS
ncbi:hypothetical protein PSPO01_15290 [Paraphaeosphaeria sporulosa]